MVLCVDVRLSINKVAAGRSANNRATSVCTICVAGSIRNVLWLDTIEDTSTKLGTHDRLKSIEGGVDVGDPSKPNMHTFERYQVPCIDHHGHPEQFESAGIGTCFCIVDLQRPSSYLRSQTKSLASCTNHSKEGGEAKSNGYQNDPIREPFRGVELEVDHEIEYYVEQRHIEDHDRYVRNDTCQREGCRPVESKLFVSCQDWPAHE